MNPTVDLRCRCGEVEERLENAARDTVNRVVCYCDDCQAYLHHLGRADLLDAHGGSDIVQVAPASLAYVRGKDRIAGVRLKPKGLFHRPRESMRAGGPGLLDESANSQTGGGAPCQLHFTRADASLSGTTLTIEVLEKYDAPNISSSDCTPARAQALSSSPECRRIERWTGTRR